MTTRIEPLEILNAQGAQHLLDAIQQARGNPVTIDFSQIRHLGAQAVQVLLSARKSWADDGHAFEIGAPSQAALDALNLLGLAELASGEVAT